MNKQTITIIFLLLPLLLISSNFYKNLAEDGKRLYLSGKYEEAIENFRIAEFGLTENKEVISKMYLYFALAHFKLSNGDDVFKIIDKLKRISGITNLEKIKIPDEIKADADTMFSVIDKSYKKKLIESQPEESTSRKSVSPDTEEKFEYIFNELKNLLKKNELQEVKTGLKKLKKINKNDIRAKFISGVLFFRENKYKKAINELIPVSRLGSGNLKGESSYYLALSNYFEKNYGQFLASHQKINKNEINGKLSDIKSKVLKIRKKGINSIKDNFFNKKQFLKFAKSFNGDISLASSIFKEVLKKIQLRTRDVYFWTDAVLKYSGTYNTDFIFKVSDYFIDKEQDEYSVDIIKRSKFFKNKDKTNIEIYYKLGLIYNNMGNHKAAKKMMLKVYNINKGYKRVNYYLTK